MDNQLNIQTIIWDLDQTLYSYWGGLCDAFSFYTATSAHAKIIDRPKPDIDYLVEVAKDSYAHCGLTTTFLATRYNLYELGLYRDHHDRMIRDLVKPQWDRKAGVDQRLCDYFSALSSQGITNLCLTHGTKSWGEEILKLRGLRDHMAFVDGIDSYGLWLKNKEGRLFRDFMKNAGLAFTNDNLRSTLIVEDSPDNLRLPKFFGMQTALLATPRVTVKDHQKPWIDRVITSPTQALQIPSRL